MIIRNQEFDFASKVYIMGILNVTPDSFSDGGKHNERNQAVQKALNLIDEGADIIDIGGESTRPGFTYVSEEEEISRVVPVVRQIRQNNQEIVISVDTTKASVAREALKAGADIINDVSGFLLDDKMIQVCIDFGVPAVLMHDSQYFNNDRNENNEINENNEDYILKLITELKCICDKAIANGVKKENIIIDPGVGFGKSYEENLMIIRDLDRIASMDYPLLLGCSRKSVIGLSLDLPVDNRLEGTITTSVYGAMMGAGILRVHDVKENKRAINMLDSIRQLKKNPSK